jgi:hypothetical protein
MHLLRRKLLCGTAGTRQLVLTLATPGSQVLNLGSNLSNRLLSGRSSGAGSSLGNQRSKTLLAQCSAALSTSANTGTIATIRGRMTSHFLSPVPILFR